MDMEAQGVLGMLERLLAGWRLNEKSVKIIRCLFLWALSFLLSLVRCGGSGAPFGIAMTAACGAGWYGLAALLGAVSSYFLGGGLGWGLRCIAAAVLVFTAGYIFGEFSFSRRGIFMPLAAALMTALSGFLGSFSLSGVSSPDPAKLLLESVLAGAGCYFFHCALRRRAPLSESDETRRSVSLTVLGACVLMAFVPLKLFGTVSVGRTLALIVLMASAVKGGMMTGAAAGTLLGIAMDLADGSAAFHAASYALCGLLSGVFSRHSRLVFTLSFVLSSALSQLFMWNAALSQSALFETFCASVIFFLLPGRFLAAIGMLLHSGEHGGGERDLRRYVASSSTA